MHTVNLDEVGLANESLFDFINNTPELEYHISFHKFIINGKELTPTQFKTMLATQYDLPVSSFRDQDMVDVLLEAERFQ